MKKLLLIVALLSTGCVSVSSSQPVDIQPEPLKATLAVVVSDSSGTPIPDVQVTVHTGEQGITDSAGYIKWDDIIQGPRHVKVSREGFESAAADHPVDRAENTLRIELQRSAPPIPTHPSPLVGRFRIGPTCFMDDTGCVTPIYAHAGDFFSIYIRDRAKIQHQLDLLTIEGYHGVRTWTALGCPPDRAGTNQCFSRTFWVGREINPAWTPDYAVQLEAFLRELAVRNLRVVLSAGDIGEIRDRRAYMELVASIEKRLDRPVIDWVDCGNEAWQTGESDPNALARCVHYYKDAGGKALLTLTSPPGETPEELNAYSIPPADAYDVHSYRGGFWYDKRRHIFSTGYDAHTLSKPFGISSEPPGNGRLVSASQGKHELDDEAVILFGLVGAFSRQAWVWFSGQGVQVEGGLEQESGFRLPSVARKILPRDVATYEDRKSVV